MRVIAAFLILFVLLLSQPNVAATQELSPSDREKLRRAGKVADLFIERFRQTRDFGIAWNEFHLSDASCTYRANGFLRGSDYDRLKLSNALSKNLYIAFMDYYYLKAAHDLSIVRIESNSDESEESITPREIRDAEKKSKFFHNDDDRQPQNSEEVYELLADLNDLAKLYRKFMPPDVMMSAAWRDNYKYLTSKGDINHGGIRNGLPSFCVPARVKVYIVDRGIFYFYLVEEKGRMKVAGLGID